MATPKRAAAARVALNLSHLTVAEKVALGRAAAASIAADPATFPNPPLPPAQLKALADGLDQAESDARTARQVATVKTSARDDAMRKFDESLTDTGKYVDLIAKGDATIIGKASLTVRGTPVRKTTAPEAPANLIALAGARPGEAKLHFGKPAGAKSFVVETTANPNDESTWKRVSESGGKTRITISGLPSGRQWFRVAAQGAQGLGPFSDPATCIVP